MYSPPGLQNYQASILEKKAYGQSQRHVLVAFWTIYVLYTLYNAICWKCILYLECKTIKQSTRIEPPAFIMMIKIIQGSSRCFPDITPKLYRIQLIWCALTDCRTDCISLIQIYKFFASVISFYSDHLIPD